MNISRLLRLLAPYLCVFFATTAVSPVVVDAAQTPESTAFLAENASKPGVKALPSGLQYKVLKSGDGREHPQMGTSCSCHYEGTLIDGTVFDSSYERGSPTSFAPSMVIKGWTEAMQLMVEGDKWEMYIPSDLAYGDKGSPPKIPGGSALIFKMEMLEINGPSVPAVKCDPDTLDKCDDKEKTYVAKMKSKFGEDADAMEGERKRIEKVSDGGSAKEELLVWAKRRMIILEKMIEQATSGGDDDGEEL